MKLENKVQELCKHLKVTRSQFIGAVITAELSLDTAERLWEGDTNFSTSTLGIVADIFHVSIADLVDVKK